MIRLLIRYILLYVLLTSVVIKKVNNENEVNVSARNRCSLRNIRHLSNVFKLLVCGICHKGKGLYINGGKRAATQCLPCLSGYYNDGTKKHCKKCKTCQEANDVSSRYFVKCTSKHDTMCYNDVKLKRLKTQTEKIIKHAIRHARQRKRKFLRILETKVKCKSSIGGSCNSTVKPPMKTNSTEVSPRIITSAYHPELEEPVDLEEEEPASDSNTSMGTLGYLSVGMCVFVFGVCLIVILKIIVRKKGRKRKENHLYVCDTDNPVTERDKNLCVPGALLKKNTTFLAERTYETTVHADCLYDDAPKTKPRSRPHSMSSRNSFNCNLSSLLGNRAPCSYTDLSMKTHSSIGITFPFSNYHDIVQKSTDYGSQNIFVNYFKDTASQTQINNIPQTIFNGQWDMYGTFNTDGGCLFKVNSSIELKIPRYSIAEGDNVEIYGAIFTDLVQMREVFDLYPNEWMTSAAVEYYKPGGTPFQNYVTVRIEHCLSSGFNPKFFKVLWFRKNDHGRIAIHEVTREWRFNKGKDKTWFKFGAENTVVIHTRHFSGFFCSYCGHEDIPVSLTAEVFVSHELIDEKHREVNLSLYLWDTKCFIKDFKEYTKEINPGMTLCSKQEVRLCEDVDRDSTLACTLQPTGHYAQTWQHILRPEGNKHVFKEKQKRKLNKIVKCCRESGPQLIQWTLQGDQRVFQCIIDIIHVVSENNDSSDNDDGQTTIYISNVDASSPNLMRLERGVGDVDRLRRIGHVLAEELTVAQTQELAKQLGIEHFSCNRPIGHNPDSIATKYSILEECMEKNRHAFDHYLRDMLGQIGSLSVYKRLVEYAFSELPETWPPPIQETGAADAMNPKRNDDHQESKPMTDDTEPKGCCEPMTDDTEPKGCCEPMTDDTEPKGCCEPMTDDTEPKGCCEPMTDDTEPKGCCEPMTDDTEPKGCCEPMTDDTEPKECCEPMTDDTEPKEYETTV